MRLSALIEYYTIGLRNVESFFPFMRYSYKMTGFVVLLILAFVIIGDMPRNDTNQKEILYLRWMSLLALQQ